MEVAIKKMIDTSQRIIRIKFSDYNCNSYFEPIRKNHKSSGVYFRDDIRKDFELKGGPGDDLLFQSASGSTEGPITDITPDGKKDILDCGDGNDEAWGNVNTDHDEFRNCEVVHHG